MRLKPDVRHELSIVTLRAAELLRALRALPDTQEGMIAAAQTLSLEERGQALGYLGELSFQCYQLHERTRWLKRRIEETLLNGDTPAGN